MIANTTDTKNDALWTIDRVAQRFGVSRRHIRRLMERGGFVPPIRIGGALRFDPLDIEDYIESQKQRGHK